VRDERKAKIETNKRDENNMIKYVIWGAGHRGRILYELLGKERIIAYLDSNPDKIGKTYLDCPIIDYSAYKAKYKSYAVIVTMVFGGGVTEILEQDQIFYFDLEKCPPEFMGYGLTIAKNWFKNKEWNFSDGILLYGSTLYTVLVYEKLRKQGYQNISVFLPSSMNQKKQIMFSKMFPEICLAQKNNLHCNTILLTEKTTDLEIDLKNVPVIDIVDWTQYIEDYQNRKIELLKDQYKNRRCFIVATGPSLTYDDLACLHQNHEFCISMNSIFTCFPKTQWRPDCYTVLDAGGILMWRDQFHKLKDVAYKFIADSQPYFDYTQLDDSWYIYHSILDDYSIKNMLFSDDFSKKVYNGSTVTYACIQLAVYLGFQEIYLLGLDHNYKKDVRSHFTDQAEPEEIFDGMNEQNRILDVSYAAYQKAKKYALENNIKIYNATRKTCLDVFEQVDFDTLFDLSSKS